MGRRLSLRKKDEQSPKPTPSKVDEEESQIHSEKRPTVPQSVHDHQDEEPVNEGDIQFSDKDKDEIDAENKEIVSGQQSKRSAATITRLNAEEEEKKKKFKSQLISSRDD